MTFSWNCPKQHFLQPQPFWNFLTYSLQVQFWKLIFINIICTATIFTNTRLSTAICLNNFIFSDQSAYPFIIKCLDIKRVIGYIISIISSSRSLCYVAVTVSCWRPKYWCDSKVIVKKIIQFLDKKYYSYTICSSMQVNNTDLKFIIKKKKKKKVLPPGSELPTFGSWVQRVSTAPLAPRFSGGLNNIAIHELWQSCDVTVTSAWFAYIKAR